MARFLRSTALTLAAVALLSLAGQAQRSLNLSGKWELVEALMTGPGRDGSTSDEPRPTRSVTVSGAAFNCGRGCTITHKGQTLTIAHADPPGTDRDAVPIVTFQLDDREHKVTDSFNHSIELPVVARLQDGGIEVETRMWGAMKQRLTTEKNELVVVTTREGGEWSTILRYRKK